MTPTSSGPKNPVSTETVGGGFDAAETVHQFIGCMNRRQPIEASDLFTEDGIFEGVAREMGAPHGRDRIAGMLSTYLRSLEELMVQTSGIYHDKNEAVAVIEIVASLRRASLPEAGPSVTTRGERRVFWRGVYQFTLDPEGKIKRLRIFGDRSMNRWAPDDSSDQP